MNKIKKYLKLIFKHYMYLLLYLVSISTLSYTKLINFKTISLTSYIFIIFLSFSLGFKSSKISNKKGYLIGTLIGLVNIFSLYITASIFKQNITYKTLTYYLIILLSSIIAAMIAKINNSANYLSKAL